MGLDDKESAFVSLEKAFKERSDILVYMGVDPRLDPLRADARFRALERSVRGQQA